MSAVLEKIAAAMKSETIELFLSTLERTGVVTLSSAAAGQKPNVFYTRRRLDPEFEQRWHLAKSIADKEVINEVRRRAITGHDENVYHQGEIIGKKKVHSDSLLKMLAQSAATEYRDQGKLVVSSLDDERKERDELENATEEQLRAFVEMGEAISGSSDSN